MMKEHSLAVWQWAGAATTSAATTAAGAASAGGATTAGAGAATAATATATKRTVSLADTEGVTRDVGEESLEEIVRKAKNTPDFWSGDNPVLVALALTIGAGAVAGAFHG